jgi:hypothetical protein
MNEPCTHPKEKIVAYEWGERKPLEYGTPGHRVEVPYPPEHRRVICDVCGEVPPNPSHHTGAPIRNEPPPDLHK